MTQGGTTTVGTASGGTAANSSDSDYASPAGVGGTANTSTGPGTSGNLGRIVLIFSLIT
jgi:hypothetical protein